MQRHWSGPCRVLGALLLSISLFVGPVLAADGGLFDEPALDVVLWRAAPPVPSFPVPRGADVPTQRVDNLRTGTVYAAGLDQESFRSGRFKLLQSLEVNAPVTAQPLFVSALNPPVGAVIVATANNTIYAFRAGPPFDVLWQRSLGDAEWQPVDLETYCGPGGFAELEQGWSGIQATPVIDPTRGRIYVSYRFSTGKNPNGQSTGGEQRLAALDLGTGHILEHVTLNPDPLWNQLRRSRASLLLDRGVIYLGFALRCEGIGGPFGRPNHGSISAYDADSLEQIGQLNVTEGVVDGGGIWQASTGIAADGAGNLFLSTGNVRTYIDAENGIDGTAINALSNSVLRVRAERRGGLGAEPRTPIEMRIADRFTPYRKLWLDDRDLDLSAAGVVLVPGTTRVLSVGKEARMYVLDANGLGGFDESPPFDGAAVKRLAGKCDSEAPDDRSRDRAVLKQRVGWNAYLAEGRLPMSDGGACRTDPSVPAWLYWPHVHGTPVFADFGPQRQFVYVWPEKDYLRRFKWLGDTLDPNSNTCAVSLAAQRAGQTRSDCEVIPRGVTTNALRGPPFVTPAVNGMPGGMLTAVANPARDGRGVVVASVKRCAPSDEQCDSQDFGSLHVIDPVAGPLPELWNDLGAGDYVFAKYVPPTVANGRIFLATWSNTVRIYGSD